MGNTIYLQFLLFSRFSSFLLRTLKQSYSSFKNNNLLGRKAFKTDEDREDLEGVYKIIQILKEKDAYASSRMRHLSVRA